MGTLRIVAGSALALALSAISIGCCYLFGTHLAAGIEGTVYGVLGATADALKAILPLSISASLGSRQRTKALIGAVLFTVFSAYSFASEIGLYSLSRDAVASSASAGKEAYQGLKSERDRIAARLKELGSTRLAGTIQADVSAAKLSKAFTSSNECKEVSTAASRELCARIDHLGGELSAAEEAERLRSQDSQLATKLGGLDLAKVLANTDAQAAALSRFTGFSPETIRDALAVLVAALVELGSGFGLYAVSAGSAAAPGKGTDKDGQTERSKEPAATRQRRGRGKRNSDPIKAFAKDMVTVKAGSEVTAAAVFLAYEAWCQANGEKPLTATGLGRALGKAGWTRTKRGGIARYQGVALRNDAGEKAAPRLKLASVRA